ncbi:sulfurtransferase [bacterium]|nr:sulfurtransferase [bacterium]
MNRFRIITAGAIVLIFSLSTTASAGLKDYFVDTQWLDSNREKVVVVDVRNPIRYLLGHIEGAINIHRGEFLSTRHGTKSLVPTADEFEKLMDRNGITPETVVVAYAQHDNPYMARFIWTLRFHGHDRSYVLDGGYEKWDDENLPTDAFPTIISPTSGYTVTKSADIRAEGDYVLTRLNNPTSKVWDVRRKSEYNGLEVRADRGGHIPGAVHLEWDNLLREENGVKVLKEEEEIELILQAAGITRDVEIIAHCQTGIRSSYATLVLLSLGYNARNYDGSWLEWANCKNYPVEDSHEQASLDPGSTRSVFSW